MTHCGDVYTFATFLIDRNGTVTDWGPDARRLLGWTASEAVGRPATEVLELNVPTLLGMPEDGDGVRAATPHTRDGTTLDLELAARPLIHGGGRLHSVVVTVHPPYDPREDEELDLVARAFDQAPFPVSIHDRDLRYCWINDS